VTYDGFEKSRNAALPQECYRFAVGATIYRYTSSDSIVSIDVAGDGLFDFLPEAIERDDINFNQEDHSGTITVGLGRFNPVAQLFMAYAPSSPCAVTIYRKHRFDPDNEIVVAFTGKIVAATFDGSLVQLVCAPLSAVLKRNIPRLMFQRACNWALYGPGCGVDKGAFRLTGTVGSVSGFNMTATVFGTMADGWLTGGWVELVDGSKRFIEDHVGTTITLQAPFFGLVGGETIYAFAGCDRSEATCLGKFNNLAKHSGFERIPLKNPFELGLT
jgi:uncharacterized phage protein (TIGR02218 family)